jgi:indole-3-acetate monooxygenase
MTSTVDAPSAVEDPTTIDFGKVADPVERARLLAPIIRDSAERTESNGTLSPDIVDLVKQAELFWTLAPTEVGGLGADVVQGLCVTEELSAADGSTGWSVMANMSVTGFMGGHASDTGVETLYRTGGRSVIAGMFAPMGKVDPVAGGYTARGSYSFGSGTGHADWIGGGAKAVDQNGPYDLIFLVPRSEVVFKGGWDVLGLAGTGSYDYEIPEQFVDTDFTVRREGGRPLRGQASQYLGLQVMGSAGHAGVALGIARRALEELHGVLAQGRVRPGAIPVLEQQLFLHDFAVAEANLSSARAYVMEAFGDALDTVTKGDPYTELQYQRIRQASTWVTRVGMDTVNFAYTWSGSKGLREPSAMARCLRDMHAATQHVYVDSTTMVKAASALLDAYATA